MLIGGKPEKIIFEDKVRKNTILLGFDKDLLIF